MQRYIWKSFVRGIKQSPFLYALSVLGVGIGVGSVLSIQIINQNAMAAFTGSVQAVSGEADLSLESSTGALNEEIIVPVLATPGVRDAWPLLRVQAVVESEPQVFLEVLGLDFLQPRGRLSGTTDLEAQLEQALGRPGWIAVTPSLAGEMNWQLGDSLRLASGSRRVVLHVGAYVDFQSYAPAASNRLAVMDIAQAQSLLGEHGLIQQIDLSVASTHQPQEVASALEDRLGSAIQVQTANQRKESAQGLLRAFRLNLTALSLISLFVGLYLIFTTTQATLVRRRVEFGVLASMGATRRQMFVAILAEISLLGMLGTVTGLVLGYVTAWFNVDRVSATLTNIYMLHEIENLRVSPSMFGLAALVGVGGSCLGGLLPAWEVSHTPPQRLLATMTLHARVRRRSKAFLIAGTSFLLVPFAIFGFWGESWRPMGFVLGFMTLFAIPFVTPALLHTLTRNIPVAAFDFAYGWRGLSARLQTSAVAVSALAMAVSMLLGVTLLIGSFRKTLETWVASSVRADIFVTTTSWQRAERTGSLDDELQRSLAAHPSVRAMERLRQFHAFIGDRRILLSGLESNTGLTGPDRVEVRIPLRHGQPQEAWHKLRRENAILISEPLARKESLGLGDTLWIDGPRQKLPFRIAGVSYDYSTEAGSALLDLAVMDRAFGPGPVTNVALYLKAGEEPQQVIDQLRAQHAEAPLLLRSNRDLRREIFGIFDQTFAVTRLLQGMALLVAATGIALTLLILSRQRRAEFALYGALGALRRQIFKVFVFEGLSLGLFGILIGGLGGLLLAWILIDVINPMYFGWSIRPGFPWTNIVLQILTILAVVVGASFYPALKASRTPVGDLSREEL